MYKRTFWIDDVEGIQDGTPLNADNFNNLEGGAMEASALAALVSAYHRANEGKVQPVKQGGTGADNAANARKNLGISGVVTGTYVGTGTGTVTRTSTGNGYTYSSTGENIISLPFTPSAVLIVKDPINGMANITDANFPLYLISGGDIRGMTLSHGEASEPYGFIVEKGFAVVSKLSEVSTPSTIVNNSNVTYRYIAFE